ncbi:MAG: elongation factor P [candidate division Zixibacteria bacterium]|nr:elongation factor P [candidate division Zixibacteria bacterium]
MIDTSDFRIGMRLQIDKDIFYIIDFQHARTAQRKANVTTKLKNIRTGQVLEKSFSAGEKFVEPDFDERMMQFLYNDQEGFHFMDSKTYDQIALNEEQIGQYKWYLQENVEYQILFFEGNPINVEMPAAVVLVVIEAEPAVKGDTVSNITKLVKVETGLEIKAPMFIKIGDKLKIDTREGKYLERA